MVRTWITVSVALVLILMGVGIFYYKVLSLGYPILPDHKVSSWYVEYSATIDTTAQNRKDGLEVSIKKPGDNARYAVTNLQIIAPGFGIEGEGDKAADDLDLAKRGLNRTESFLLRFNIFSISNDTKQSDSKFKTFDRYAPDNRISNPDDATAVFYDTIDEVVGEAREKSAGDRAFTRQIIKGLLADRNNVTFLMDGMEVQTKEDVILALLGVEGIKARIANGFALESRNNNVDVIKWVEIFDTKRKEWIRISTGQSKVSNLDKYFVWWYGTGGILQSDTPIKSHYSLSLRANRDGSLTRKIWLDKNQPEILRFFSLQNLPLEQQFIAQLLLLLPLGAFLVSFGRQVIGFQTFGTFMPVLIAMAFRETGILYGIAFFCSVIGLGLIARAYVTKLHLLMVPRLSVVLSVIVMIIVLMMLITKEQDISLGISVALFPVIIITMFIERMSTVLDEESPKDAFIGFVGTMAVSSVIYMALMNIYTMHIIFVFPELLLVNTAFCMLLGRYNGYKLFEYWRFRNIQRQAVPDNQ